MVGHNIQRRSANQKVGQGNARHGIGASCGGSGLTFRVASPNFGMRPMPKDTRQKRDLHALDDDGMVLCNPRDKEAAHRAEMEGIAMDDRAAVTCRKCLSLLYARNNLR